MDQRTEEWFKQRLGKGTASKANDMRSKTGVKRKNYAIRLLTERRTQMPVDAFVFLIVGDELPPVLFHISYSTLEAKKSAECRTDINDVFCLDDSTLLKK